MKTKRRSKENIGVLWNLATQDHNTIQTESQPYCLKTSYSSKIDIFIQERFNKLIYGINTIIKYGIWQPVKFQFVSRFWTGSKVR